MKRPDTFIVSDESVNQYGFRVLTAGIRTENFRRNPVGFYNHQREAGVICRWSNIRQEGSVLVADVEFDLEDELGKAIAGKVERGFIRAASIGFRVISVSEDPALMLPGQTLPTVTECELIEISVVDIPGNRNALALYDESGNQLDLDTADWKKLYFIADIPMNAPKITIATLIALGLQEGATAEAVEAAVKSKNDEIARLRSELQAIEEARQNELKTRVKQLLDTAVQQKKITEAERKEYESLGLMNFFLLESTLQKIPAPALPSRGVKTAEEKPAEGLRAAVGTRTLRQLEKEDPKLVLRIKREDPELYRELYEAQYRKTGG